MQEKDNSNSLFSFGKSGWGLILFCLAMFWFYVGFVTDGTNVMAPAAAANIGVDKSVILTMNSLAGLAAIIIYIMGGQFNKKIGSKTTAVVAMIISAIGYVIIGNTTSLIVYTVCMALVAGAVMTFAFLAGSTLVSQWFPKRKGVVMGWTTAGMNIGSATFVAMMTPIVGALTIQKAVLVPAIMLVILAVLGVIFIKNTPGEKGLYPDMVSKEKYEAEYDTNEDDNSRWTVGTLLKTKELWTCSIVTGGFQICSAGIMSQLVSRNIENGYDPGTAVTIMSVIAVIGVVGSFLIGVIDQKIGTKKTCIGFAVWYAAALLCNFSGTKIGVAVSIFMIGMSIGGSANFTASLPTSVFGRQGYETVNSVVFPIQSGITALAFLIDGWVLGKTGELKYTFLVFAIVSLCMIIPLLMTEDHKYNLDWKAGNNA